MAQKEHKSIKNKLVIKFEKKDQQSTLSYFDVSDIEEIVEYYIELGLVNKAKNAINYGIKLHGENYNLLILEAKYQVAQINFVAAEKALDKAEIISPGNGEIDLIRALILIFTKKFSKANILIKKGLRKSHNSADYMFVPIGMAYMQQKMYMEAAVFLKKYWERYEDAEDILVEIALAYYHAGKYKLALKFYQKHLDIAPYDADAWIQLARIHEYIGMKREALESYDFALSINPSLLNIYLEKGVLLLTNNQVEKAQDCFSEFLRYEKNGIVLQKMGEVNFALKRTKEAQKYFEEAQKYKDIDASNLYYHMAKNFMFQENFEKALEAISKAIQINDIEVKYWLLKGKVLNKQKLFSKAEDCYKQGLKINDKNVELWINYSELFYYQDNISHAQDIIQSAMLRIENNSTLMYRNCAYLLINKERKLAEKCFEKAFKLDESGVNELINFFPQALRVGFIKKAYNQVSNN